MMPVVAIGELKYKKVYTVLKDEILKGKYSAHGSFPSVMQVCRRFGIARLTVVKVFDKLKGDGLIVSHWGAGTFVARRGRSRKVGLIVPGISYSEFFPPIVSEISRLSQEEGYVLLFGDTMSNDPHERERKTKSFAEQLVAENVGGVIYQPLESLMDSDKVNREVVDVFGRHDIPVVLLDCDIVHPPDRSDYDFVGINNYEAGWRLARHLIEAGARRISFLIRPEWAPTIHARFRGACFAVSDRGGVAPMAEAKCQIGTFIAMPADVEALRRHMKRVRPDAFICGNDTTAAKFKQTLESAGYAVPDDVLLAGFDDVRVASLMTPSLTTIHQPCEDIARIVFEALISRMENPQRPTREIFLKAPLIVRKSTQRKGGRR